MKIDPNSKTFHGASTFVMFVALNVLFVITCIPVITIGMATSALFEATLRYSDDEGGQLINDYLTALRRNAGRATAVYLCLVAPLVALAFSGLFWLFQGGIVSLAAAIVAFLGAVYLFTAFLYGMALVARYRNSVRQTVKNAMLLSVVEPWRTFVLAVIPATVVSLTAVFPVFIVIVATIGFSVGAYAVALLFRSVFAKH
ncbi:MAG TPA: DUF624 domain-containing protein [Microbacteriaceae bacterium]